VEFLCEDLPQHGLVLVPPSSPDYAPLLADIRQRLDNPADGAPPIPPQYRPRISEEDHPTSAILLNKSAKTIAALQVFWRFETEAGRSYRHSHGMLSVQTLLRYGGSAPSFSPIMGYWHTIFPGSKRYLAESGMVGDNTDVRPPAPEEKWRGGIMVGGSSGGGPAREPIKQITLVLDGVFFLDGEFVGPNREKLFEQTVADAEAHMSVARIARDAHNNGTTSAQILAEIEKVTGPAPEHPPMMNLAFRNPDVTQDDFRRAALQQIAFQLANRRKFPQAGDDGTVYMVMAWADTVLPNFRKL